MREAPRTRRGTEILLLWTLLAQSALLAAGSGARADGVIEINDARAAAPLPGLIDRPGSYRLRCPWS